MAGREKAFRAVGNANRNNPLAIIIPCHRCIAKNGKLHGYFYGLEKKKFLLDLEKK
jgi:methylated-DNA-[protein]-cysteine S-methyltransferase